MSENENASSSPPPPAVVPGTLLGETSAVHPGANTHVSGERVYASVSGACTFDASTAPLLVSVRSIAANRALAAGSRSALPAVGETVTCRVTRINPRMVHLDILCARGVALRLLRAISEGAVWQDHCGDCKNQHTGALCPVHGIWYSRAREQPGVEMTACARSRPRKARQRVARQQMHSAHQLQGRVDGQREAPAAAA